MTKTYVQILVFPCGDCNWPITETQHSAERQPEQSFAGRQIDLKCSQCEWEGTVLGSQAEVFQEAEWNFEIHSGIHTDKKQSKSEE